MVFILLALWWIRIRSLWKLPNGRDWLRGKLGLVLMGRAMLSKSLTQISVARQGCVPSLLFDLRPNYGRGNEDNGDLLQKVPCMHCCTEYLQPCSRLLPTHTSAGDVWTLTGKSLGVTAPFSWVLLHTRFCLCPPRVCFPVLCKFWQLYFGVNDNLLREGLCHTQVCCTQSPCPCGRPLLTCTSPGDAQMQFCLRLCGVPRLWCAQGLFEPSECLWREWGLILNANSPLLPPSI